MLTGFRVRSTGSHFAGYSNCILGAHDNFVPFTLILAPPHFMFLRNSTLILSALSAVLVSGSQLMGQQPSRAAHTPVTAVAQELTGRIELDGRVDEPSWAAATPITSFTQLDPQEGEPASERTEVRILYDQSAIYIGAIMYDRSPVSTRLVRRDANAQDSDWIEIAFDTYHDHLSSSSFAVNPSGVRRDMNGGGGGGPGGGGPGGGGPGGGGGFGGGGGGGGPGGGQWNPIWEVATAITEEGWVAEMRIPLSQLRFGAADVQTWGIQIERAIASKNETAMFAFVPKNERSGPSRFGHLEGLRGLSAQNPLEILPYVSGRADYRLVPQNSEVNFENPFRSGADYTYGIGADLQYRLSSNLTLNATFNPDFGQAEVDPAVINLGAFETRLQENRPFFVEGGDIFRFGTGAAGHTLMYSRRIGRSPSLSGPTGTAYIDVPDQATILGAAKLSGRTASGWSIGFLEAVTSREVAPYVDTDNVQREAVVEPLSNYLTARVRRDFNDGQSTVGGILTSIYRRLEDDPTMVARLRSRAFVTGVDFRHEWAERVWSINGNFSPSYIAGSEAVLISAQNSSARYFGRPDADYLAIDSTATSMMGYSGSFDVGKRAGIWTGGLGVNFTSPGYEVNDVGFQTNADRININSNVNYRQNRPGKLFRSWGLNTGPQLSYNYGGNLIGLNAGVGLNFQLVNYWGGFFNVQRGFSTLNDRLTRGGPLTRDPDELSFGGRINSDNSKPYTVGMDGNWAEDDGGGWRRSAGVDFGLKPAGNWDLRFGPSWSRNHTAAQYVTRVNDPQATETFGRRYLFGTLDQTTVSMETRLNVNFTPNVSFELFAQPLVSSGKYQNVRVLRAPETFDFDDFSLAAGNATATTTSSGVAALRIDPDGSGPANSFTVTNRDFNTTSLRGNAVFRWEWRPGSTLFLVWQQSRAETLNALANDPNYQNVGRFDLGGNAGDLLGLRPDNVFMVKMTYWFNP